MGAPTHSASTAVGGEEVGSMVADFLVWWADAHVLRAGATGVKDRVGRERLLHQPLLPPILGRTNDEACLELFGELIDVAVAYGFGDFTGHLNRKMGL